MSDYDETVRQELEKLSTEVIVAKLKMGYFTEDAANVARETLSSRGIGPIGISESTEEVLVPPLSRRVTFFVTQCLAGKANLSSAFWTLGGALFVLMLASIPLTLLFGDGFFVVALVIGSMGSILHTISVWRCAKNTKLYAIGQAAKMYTAFQSLLPLILIGSAIWAFISWVVENLR